MVDHAAAALTDDTRDDVTFASDHAIVRRLLAHIAAGTTDVFEPWREPVANYLDPDRFAAEQSMLRTMPTVFAPSAAVAVEGEFVARDIFGVPLLAVRGRDRKVRVFRNACRHRGAILADGSGCRRAFVCGYHGWTYRLDGTLATIPQRDGFPDVELADRSLIEVDSVEANGLVVIGPLEAASAAPWATSLTSPSLQLAGQLADHRPLETRSVELPLNWKVLIEQFLEGYHIRHTHRDTFYPLQYDNINVVETHGPHSRVTYPYRAIERLTDRPEANWDLRGRATFVYQLFPNTIIATFPDRVFVIVIDPTAIDRSTLTTYVLTNRATASGTADIDPSETQLLARGIVEDNTMSFAVQRGLRTEANRELVFGRYEGALAHFHRHLDQRLEHHLQ